MTVIIKHSKATYFFNIGRLGKGVLTNDAKRNLYLNCPLKDGQSFEDLTLYVKTFIFYPYNKVEALITADVVAREGVPQATYRPPYQGFWLLKSLPHGMILP